MDKDVVCIKMPGVKDWPISHLKKCCSKNKVKGYSKMSREELEIEVEKIIDKIAIKE